MKLVLKYFGKTLKESLLEEGREYFIGRQEECDFVIPEEPGISRKHVKIYQSEESGHWIVESLSEWGGLYLEGEEVSLVELEDSGFLTLKNYVLEFIQEKEQEEEKTSSEHNSSKNSEPEKSIVTNQNSIVEVSEDSSVGKTKVLSDNDLIHSLYIYIEGEFSNHISLNDKQSWIIGRSEDCDISIDYGILTRKHLQISKIDEKFYVKELGSSNKTYLNNKEMKPLKEFLLTANDEISVADLKIVFEVRNKNHKKMMENLPVLSEKTSISLGNSPEMVMPKVVLESAPLEEESGSSSLTFLNKKRLVLLVLLIGMAGGLYFQNKSRQEKKKILAEEQSIKEKENKLEVFLQEAISNLEQNRYRLCIDQLEELHRTADKAYFKNSQEIFRDCHRGLKLQQEKEERLAQEKRAKETQGKITKIVNECKKQYAEKKIKTEEDLNQCARELLVGGLDPENSEISSIKMEIMEKSNIKALQEQKKENYRAYIQSKKALYNRAKKIQNQNKPLKAVAAYNVFLKSARGISSLKTLYQQAESERNNIQRAYDEELNQLYSSCSYLIQNKKMKSAYHDCKKILNFKSDDKKAKEYIHQARDSLRKELKPIYEQSMMHESFSRIEEAMKLWNEILERDISGGYYYKKAQSQIKKYK